MVVMKPVKRRVYGEATHIQVLTGIPCNSGPGLGSTLELFDGKRGRPFRVGSSRPRSTGKTVRFSMGLRREIF